MGPNAGGSLKRSIYKAHTGLAFITLQAMYKRNSYLDSIEIFDGMITWGIAIRYQ